jgi:hypothetical protein
LREHSLVFAWPAAPDRDVTGDEDIAGRCYARVYRASGRRDLHAFLCDSVRAAGARVVYVSVPTRAPVYLGVEIGDEERLGLLCYPFRATHRAIRNRPVDEHRLQIRYGSEGTWSSDHPLGVDIAGVDTTLVLGVHPTAGIIVGLDPLLYNPLPMGISIEFKDAEVEAVQKTGWHSWERVNLTGVRRRARSRSGIETLTAFLPARLIDYVRFEREATSLGLDPVLRMRAAQAVASGVRGPTARHLLEETFHLASREILEIIAGRKRLSVAVRGGVAEHHLIKALLADPDVATVDQIDEDGPPDAIATLRDGRRVRVECKNGEETFYANGEGRVEVQKTRASKGNPASRYYEPSQFDVLAVCLWPQDGGRPRFVYRATHDLERHPSFPDRLAVLHRINATWQERLADASGAA